MAIKLTYEKENDIPEKYRSLYNPPDGTCELWYLDMGDDDGRDHSTVIAMRDEMERAKTERKQFKAATERDTAELTRARERLRALENPKSADPVVADFQQKLAAKTEGMRAIFAQQAADKDGRIAELEGKCATATEALSAARLGAEVEKLARGRGIGEAAIIDVRERAAAIFQTVDGALVAFNPQGEKMMGKAGGLLTLGEFIDGLRADAAHLFGGGGPQSSGAGGGGGGPRGNGIRRLTSRQAGFIVR